MTDTSATPVIAAIRMTWTLTVLGMPKMCSRPALACWAPKPSEGREAEQSREHRERVDDVAGPAPDPLAEDRIEGRSDRQRQTLVEGEQRQRQRDDRVDRPRMQAPMEDRRGEAHGAGRLDVLFDDLPVLSEGRRHAKRLGDGHVIDRLEHAEEHEADAHARGEQHGEPAEIAVVRRRVLAAEAHRAPGADDEQQAEDDEDVGGAEEEPVEGLGQERPQPAENLRRLHRQRQREEDEGDDGKAGDHENRIVDVEPERPDRTFDIVLTDLVLGLDGVLELLRVRPVLLAHGLSFLA